MRQIRFHNKNSETCSNSDVSSRQRRFWCRRFWILSTISTLLISHAKFGEGANNSNSSGALITLNITQISSPLSMEALTGVSSDQCKPWSIDSENPLTWSHETKLKLLSISNIYEISDITQISSNNLDLQYSPTTLIFKNADIADPEGLGFHLTFNATPFCGSTRLPTKMLCNEDMVVPINKTLAIIGLGDGIIPSGTVTQSLCGGRYFVSYRYTFSCSNLRFSSPSCKTSCRSISNATHCFWCDEQDGGRRCCPGSVQPECTIVAGSSSIVSSIQSQDTLQIGGTALIIIVALAVLSIVLLSVCLLFAVLLWIERQKIHRADVAKLRANGWMKTTIQHSHKNGNGVNGRANGHVTQDTKSALALPIVHGNGNGYLHHASFSDSDDRNTNSDHAQYTAITRLPPISTVTGASQRRPASCDPTAADGNRRRQRLDINGLYSSTRNGHVVQNGHSKPRAPLDLLLAGNSIAKSIQHSSDDGYARRRDLGTLF